VCWIPKSAEDAIGKRKDLGMEVKMYFLILLLGVLFCSSSAVAQTSYIKTYSGGNGACLSQIAETPAGDLMLTGLRL
jgi:hypothetical protein